MFSIFKHTISLGIVDCWPFIANYLIALRGLSTTHFSSVIVAINGLSGFFIPTSLNGTTSDVCALLGHAMTACHGSSLIFHSSEIRFVMACIISI